MPTDGTGKLRFVPALRVILVHYLEDAEEARRLQDLQEAKAQNELALSQLALKEKTGECPGNCDGSEIWPEGGKAVKIGAGTGYGWNG